MNANNSCSGRFRASSSGTFTRLGWEDFSCCTAVLLSIQTAVTCRPGTTILELYCLLHEIME